MSFLDRWFHRTPARPTSAVRTTLPPLMPRAFGDQPYEIVKGVIVIPDISGYTELLSLVDLVHAQEVITRLMRTIILEGWEVMRVSKLIGDAALMYAPFDDRSPQDMQARVIGKIESVYRAFKAEQGCCDSDRCKCPCVACQGVPNLELKFIVHAGEFVIHEIESFRELLGREVIVAFRLLKNHATGHRYVLMTEDFISLDPAIEARLKEQHVERYEHLGEIRVGVIDLPKVEAVS